MLACCSRRKNMYSAVVHSAWRTCKPPLDFLIMHFFCAIGLLSISTHFYRNVPNFVPNFVSSLRSSKIHNEIRASRFVNKVSDWLHVIESNQSNSNFTNCMVCEFHYELLNFATNFRSSERNSEHFSEK